MTQPLGDFIASTRLADSIEEERFLIKSEQADLRSYIRECDPELRPRIVSKMVFLSILGENVAYGQMEVLTLMSSEQFSYKRIGYMAAGVLLDESSELTVLLTHTLLKDLRSNNFRIQCLALTLLANMGTAEMCQSLVTEVQRLIETQTSCVMKRAAMAALRIVKHIPDLAESFKPSIQQLLKHGSHSVVISAINLMEQMILSQPDMRKNYGRYQSAFTKILRQLSQTKASREFLFSVFNDPFLQMKILKILSIIKKPSDELDEVLESIVTGVDIKRNTGRAILFQAVEAIVSTAKKPALRGLAFSQIGRLFKFRESNVLYSALSVFSRVLYSGHEIVDRTSGDSIALQRYKSLVVQCLSHRDSSVRRRALDVVSALVDANNVSTLIPEVIDYIKFSDTEFRIELVAKIFTAVQRFSPDVEFTFNMTHRLLIENGNYVGSDIISSFSKMVTNNPPIHAHAVKQLMLSMANHSENQTLVQVAAWTIGEFASQEFDAYENMKKLMEMPHTSSQTKGYIIVAMGKLAVRFNHKEETADFLEKNFINDLSLDVQQRAGEMATLLRKGEICAEVLAPVEMKKHDEKAKLVTSPNTQNQQQASLIDNNKNDDVVKDLLDLGDEVQKNNSPQSQNSDLKDLLDIMNNNNNTSNIENAATGEPSARSKIKPFPGAVVAAELHDYIIYFEVRKNPANKNQIAIRVSTFNLCSSPLNNFSMKFGVPPGWILQAQQPSSNVLQPVGGAPIIQQIMLSSQSGAPLMMKILINYLYGSQPITENAEVNQSIFI